MKTSQTNLAFPLVFNPAAQTAEELVSNFVIRVKDFKELFQAIKNDDMKKPSQHYLIQGQRGYGKTTLLLRLSIEIQKDEKLQNWLIPIMFDEEQYAIHTLAGLWEEVISILADQDPDYLSISQKIDALYDEGNPEMEIFNLLTESLKEKGKKIVILLDNFGDMIIKFTRKENQRLREVLISSNQIRLIGASSATLEFYYQYKEPLFDFFKVISLEELNREETISLLTKLGETYKTNEIDKIIDEQPERVEALRRLTGGVPRTVVILFEIFVDDVDGNSFRDLEMVLDKVTPLYKHRLDNLATQQQVIIDAIAQSWDAISTKEIAKKVRMPSKAVSSQLNQLEKNQLINKIPTATKNYLYQIKERFFNIYYLMRLGKRKNRNKVLWLVKFFEICCSERGLIEKTQRHIKAMQENRLYEKHAFYISDALSKTRIPFDLQHELLLKTREFLSSKQSKFIKDLEPSHIEIIQNALQDMEKGDFETARKKLEDDGIPSSDISYWIAEFHRRKKDIQNAISLYIDAINQGHIGAMFSLALLYHVELKDFPKAATYYKLAAEKGDNGAMNNLANLYRAEFKDFPKAETYYKLAAEKGHTEAMFNLALLYETEFKDSTKAEIYYRMAVNKGDADAMNNLANLYFNEHKNKEEALLLQKQAYEKLKNTYSAQGYMTVLLWNDEIEQAIIVYRDIFDNEETQKEVSSVVGRSLLNFLAKKQYSFLYGLFKENKYDLKDKYKPIYYALISLMGEKYSEEFKRMGDELKEAVKDVLKAIDDIAKDLEEIV